MKPLRILVALAGLLLLLLLGYEFQWRWRHALLKPQAPSADGAWVAEVRSLPPGAAPGDRGVYLRKRAALLRSLQPRLVFAGDCEQVETRWFGARRLVIDCELRAGEPRLLRPLVDDVVIELVVQRRFAQAPALPSYPSWPRSRSSCSSPPAPAG